MATLNTLSVAGRAFGAQAAALPADFVRLQELLALFSGVAPLSHTHPASQITDFNAAVTAILDAYDFSPDIPLQAAGGLFLSGEGYGVNSGVVSFVGHKHHAADVLDFDAVVRTVLAGAFVNTASLHWGNDGTYFSGIVQLQASGGLMPTGGGLAADFGPGTNQVARGDHTHALLHNPVTLAASDSMAASLADQQLTLEVRLGASGGLTLNSGVVCDFGTGHSQVARGDHTHALLHNPVIGYGTDSFTPYFGSDQHFSGVVRCDPAPGDGYGKVQSGGGGLKIPLGTAHDVAAFGDHTHSAATTSVDGFLSKQDKAKLDALYSGVINQGGDGSNIAIRVVAGSVTLYAWDAAAYAADNSKPWRALGCYDGQTVWGAPTALPS